MVLNNNLSKIVPFMKNDNEYLDSFLNQKFNGAISLHPTC